MAEEDSVVAIVHATQVAEDSVLLAVEVAVVIVLEDGIGINSNNNLANDPTNIKLNEE